MRTAYRAATALAAGLLTLGLAVPAGAQSGRPGRFDRPFPGFAPSSTVLRDGKPGSVGLDPATIARTQQRIAEWTRTGPGPHPMYAGAVGLFVHDGTVVSRRSSGYELRYADASGTELPRNQWESTNSSTIFDLASLTKLFTSIATAQLVERGQVALDAPVARYLPEFGVNGKRAITVRELLTHTSGLQPDLDLWKDYPDRPSRVRAVLNVAPQHPPGTHYEYSDLNMITLGFLVQRVTGSPLDEVVHDRITAPLGMTDTGFHPPRSKLHRIAATEDEQESHRGMVRGQVHDENAWSLGGVAGHAGIFSTADDLAVLGQTILNGGTYRGHRILEQSTVRQMLANQNAAFPGHSHGLGFELNQRWYMDALSGPRTAGHTGFTGTSLVVDPASRSIAILLTNRVHPNREWGSNTPARRRFASGMAEALAVEPRRGRDAWFSHVGPNTTATLTTDPLRSRGSDLRVGFQAFVDTQQNPDGVDPLILESSTDGGRTWSPVPVRASGRGAPHGPQQQLAGAGHRSWWQVHAVVFAPGDSAVQLRWRYTTDGEYSGRGVNVDGVSVRDGHGTVLDGERQPDALHARGWEPRSR